MASAKREGSFLAAGEERGVGIASFPTDKRSFCQTAAGNSFMPRMQLVRLRTILVFYPVGQAAAWPECSPMK